MSGICGSDGVFLRSIRVQAATRRRWEDSFFFFLSEPFVAGKRGLSGVRFGGFEEIRGETLAVFLAHCRRLMNMVIGPCLFVLCKSKCMGTC